MQRISKQLVFGVGNWVYPKSRHSVGSRLVDGFAEKLQVEWKLHPRELMWIAKNKEWTLAKSRTYLIRDVGSAVAAALEDTNTKKEHLTVVFHHRRVELGDWSYSKEKLHSNEAILSILNTIGPGFNYVGIGVKPPLNQVYGNTAHGQEQGLTDLTVDNLFFANKLPEEHWRIIENKIAPNLEDIILKK